MTSMAQGTFRKQGEIEKIFQLKECTNQRLNKFAIRFPTNIKKEHKPLFVATALAIDNQYFEDRAGLDLLALMGVCFCGQIPLRIALGG